MELLERSPRDRSKQLARKGIKTLPLAFGAPELADKDRIYQTAQFNAHGA